MHRKLYNRKLTFRKCGLFPWDSFIEAGGNLAATIYASNKQLEGTKYAADQSYQGQLAANKANIDIANQTNSSNYVIASEANRANQRLAQQQNQWNLEQWNRQNEYNSPANQMKLYKEAGLNPNLAQGQFSPATPLQSSDLANQQVGNPMVAAHVENPNAQSADIMARGAMQRADIMKTLVKDSVEVAKAGQELIKQKVENGALPKLLKQEVEKRGKEIEQVSFNLKRGKDLLPYEINNAFRNGCLMQAQEYQYKSDTWYKNEMAQSQKNLNSIWDSTKSALAEIPKAQLNEINQHAYSLAMTGAISEKSKDFIEEHGYDMNTFSSIYGADMGYRSTKYSADKSYDLGLRDIKNRRQMFRASQKQDWRKFNYDMRLQKYLQRQKNLNSLQVAGIMAGASIANGIMNNLMFGIDSKRRNQLGRMQFDATMKRFESNPADTYMNYFNTYGTLPGNY